MRYYHIAITSPTNAFSPKIYTTLAQNGNVNGSALQVDLDIFQTFFHQPSQVGSVIIYGVDFSDLNQSANWNGAQITISIGMSAGLPLANPAQSGQVINGTILQSFGNWQGTYVSLNLLIIPSTINPDADVNLSFNWAQGATLQSAITSTLNIAYPTLSVFGALSQNLVFTETQAAQYFTLKTFSQFINNVSKQIINDANYIGASINVTPGGFILTDGTTSPQKTTLIEFNDFVGNLTWLDIATIQAKLVMRADLNIGEKVIIPRGAPTTNTATSFSQLRNLTSFNGEFLITKIRHVGSSRHADANAWVTIVDCVVPGII